MNAVIKLNNDNNHNNNAYNNIDYDKVLNSKCCCGTGLPWKNDEVVMLYPCEHMFHSSCLKSNNSNQCPFCENYIERLITMLDPDIHHQRFADILSMSYFDDMC